MKLMTLSPPQMKALSNLDQGLLIHAHVRGVSPSGFYNRTVPALLRRGLIDGEGRLTDAGRSWIKHHKEQCL